MDDLHDGCALSRGKYAFTRSITFANLFYSKINTKIFTIVVLYLEASTKKSAPDARNILFIPIFHVFFTPGGFSGCSPLFTPAPEGGRDEEKSW